MTGRAVLIGDGNPVRQALADHFVMWRALPHPMHGEWRCGCGLKFGFSDSAIDHVAEQVERVNALRVAEALDRAAREALVEYIQARMAQAWDEGRAAERRDWEFTFDLSTPDEDRQPLSNPYRAATTGSTR